MKEPLLQRRTVLKGALAALAAIPVVTAGRATAAPMPKVDVNDPMAKALGYAPDTSKVDDKKYPTHKADAKCTNCVQYQGKPTDATGGCNIFPGKLVDGAGWCTAWAKKA